MFSRDKIRTGRRRANVTYWKIFITHEYAHLIYFTFVSLDREINSSGKIPVEFDMAEHRARKEYLSLINNSRTRTSLKLTHLEFTSEHRDFRFSDRLDESEIAIRISEL